MRRVSLHRDKAESGIIKALKAHGFSVLRINTRDCPDLLVAKGAFTALIEVKTGKAKLKPGQARFAEQWPQPVLVLRTTQDAEELARTFGEAQDATRGTE